MSHIFASKRKGQARFLKAYAGVSLAVAGVLQANAQTLFSDNFSGYNLGDLDGNESGPNQAANGGSGNPWWGPNPGNMVVASSYNGITPFGTDTHLIYGNSPNFDAEQALNIGYRYNSGQNFSGNITLSWHFYDPVGAGTKASGYNDIGDLNGYQSADGYTSTKDYSGSGPDLQRHFTSGDVILGLGANNPSGANSSVYQARILGATVANNGASYTGANGWFNTSVTRTVGWHTASISLGAPNGANTTVEMKIDAKDVLDATLGSTTMDSVNTAIFDSAWGNQVGAFDDINLLQVPEPGPISLLLIGAGIVWLVQRRRVGK